VPFLVSSSIASSIKNGINVNRIINRSDDDLPGRNTMAEHSAREHRMILWILYNRSLQSKRIAKKLQNYKFPTFEKSYEKIITDLLTSDTKIVEHCIRILEEKALKLERYHESE